MSVTIIEKEPIIELTYAQIRAKLLKKISTTIVLTYKDPNHAQKKNSRRTSKKSSV